MVYCITNSYHFDHTVPARDLGASHVMIETAPRRVMLSFQRLQQWAAISNSSKARRQLCRRWTFSSHVTCGANINENFCPKTSA